MLTAAFLQQHSLFGGLSDEEISIVLPLLERIDFLEGDLMVQEGDPGDRLYFLAAGSAEVVKLAKDFKGSTHDNRLALLQPGDTFGEMGLIDIEKRSATVRALEDVETYSMTNMQMYQLYQDHLRLYTRILLNLARDISRRLRKLDTLYINSLFC